jgi:hypothetical protein
MMTKDYDQKELSNLVHIKEQELKEINELRCNLLERQVQEKSTIIHENLIIYEKLKDDFRYNLTLLQARDQEILRLEESIKDSTQKLKAVENEKRTLKEANDVLELSIKAKHDKHEQEKNNSRKILEDLKEGISSMKWSMTEELKLKDRDIESIKEELKRAYLSRDEALESQRKDLTHTFEQLMSHREESMKKKELEIASNILMLNSKFEQLQTENSRIKNDYLTVARKHEVLVEELNAKDEINRQLQWRLEDERVNKQLHDDSSQRTVQQLTLDLSLTKDNLTQEIHELRHKLEKYQVDYTRELEYRQFLTKQLEEQRVNNRLEVERMEKEVLELQQKEATSHQHISTLKIERDSYLERVTLLKTEFESHKNTHYSKDQEINELNDEIKALKTRLIASESELMKERSTLKLLNSEYSSVKQSMNSFSNEVENDYKAKLKSWESDYEHLKLEFNNIITVLEEEKRETAALGLRLKTKEAQALELQQTIHQLKQGSVSNLLIKTKQNVADAEISSPIFSEDFGPASLPGSPLPTAHTNPMKQYNQDNKLMYSSDKSEYDFDTSRNNVRNSTEMQLILLENEKLKLIIKEMRVEMENLQNQSLDRNESVEDVKILESRLEQALNEVVRLKEDKRKLIDTINELNYELNKYQDTPVSARSANRISQSLKEKEYEASANNVFAWTDNTFLKSMVPIPDVKQNLLIDGAASQVDTQTVVRGVQVPVNPLTIVPLSNTEKTLLTQVKAREKMGNNSGSVAVSRRNKRETTSRKVMNYNVKEEL